MIKAALIGLGAMGKGHFQIYKRLMDEGYPVKLVAVCDIDKVKFEEVANSDTNLKEFKDSTGFSFDGINCYTSVDEMLEKEELDTVSIVAPTYEHYSITCKCLKKGIHVLCEKPMATNLEHCRIMIETAKKTGKNLMIGQCLRFQGSYRYLKDVIVKNTFGRVYSAFFYRGGSPTTTFWFRNREKGGGALFDQHIHDIDMVNWLFGLPEKVQSVGVSAMDGSGYDVVSTNYIYPDNIMVNTQNRWIDYDAGFDFGFRVHFERGSAICDENGFRVFDEHGNDITPTGLDESPYYVETKAFLDSVINKTAVPAENTPESTMDTIRLALAETQSCDLNGALVDVE